uniref:Dit-like phage tail protein N-terminal domain-containing protein n=1 Tax=viral metagenome TaxID=1070528 RepID=A0A6M3XXM1_9ZZZZ
MAEVIVKTGPSLTTDLGGTILVLDASMSQGHQRSAIVTEHPIEDGADITDHVRPGPVRLTIDGVISATPVGDELAFPGREIDAWTVLEQVIEEATPVTVITSLRVYSSMVITALSTIRARGEQAIFPQIEMQQISIVSAATTLLPAAIIKKIPQKASAPAKADVSAQSTKEATAAEAASTRQSLLSLLAAGLGG